MEKIELWVCPECGFEDSKILPFVYKDDVNNASCFGCSYRGTFIKSMVSLGKYMSLKDFVELTQYIHCYHSRTKSFEREGSKRIKNIESSLDIETASVFKISLDNEEFSMLNHNRHRDLKQWIYNYLKEEEMIKCEK